MFRVALLSLALGTFLSVVCPLGLVSGQADKKEKPKEKPKEEEKYFGKTVGEWITTLRTDKNPKLRRAALIALEYSDAAGRTGLPAVIAAVEKDEEAIVRQDAVMLLGRLGPKTNGALKAIVAALQNDKADAVREAAATAIGKSFTVAAPDYISALIDGLKDPHAGTRIAVAGALRNMGRSAEPAFPALFDAVKNPKEHALVRSAALHVVSRYGSADAKTVPPKTVPLMIELLKDSATPPELREAAAEGLGRSTGESAEAVTLLCQMLTAKELELRRASAISLGTLGVKANAGWPIVKDRLKYAKEKDGTYSVVEADSSVRNHLIRWTGLLGKTRTEAIDVLVEAAKYDKSTENRIGAIQELGELGSHAKAAVPALNAIADEDVRLAIRDAAEKAMTQIKLSGK